ncbi:MAG: hypothetical protein ACYC6F_03875 [Longimicrobiales bacterium]
MSSSLSEQDRRAVLDTLGEIRASPPARDWSRPGCLMALPGLLLLVLPVAGKGLGLTSGLVTPLLVLGGVLLVVGIVLRLGAGGFARGHVTAAAEAALRALEAGDEDREVLLRAATLLLCNAWAAYGPSTVEAFDFAAARARLGPRLTLVTEVEGILLEEGAIYPVFTADAGGEEHPST